MTPAKPTALFSRELPNSPEAEEGIIACALIDGQETIGRCLAANLSPLAFHFPANGQIFAELIAMHAESLPMDIEVLAERLRASGKIDAVGGWQYLAQVSGKTPTTAHAPFYVSRVAELYTLRRMISASGALIEKCFEPGAIDGLPRAVARCAELLAPMTEARTWAQAVNEAEELTRERMKSPSERENIHEISWGMADFDKFFQPMEPGELVIIGGYTSSGKSSLLRQIVWNAARQGFASLLETIEVRDAEEAVNLAGHISGVRSRHNLDKLHQAEQSELMASFPIMRNAPFSVVHQDHRLDAMLARARAFKAKNGLRVLGIDYLQIMEDVKKLKPNERPDFAISCVTSELKRFATAENCVVILLSGFNRQYVTAGDREPRLSDLDGSASIEKDASRVLLIDVPTEYTLGGVSYQQNPTDNPTDAPRFFAKVIQAKGRNQGTATVGLYFRREVKTFVPITRC